MAGWNDILQITIYKRDRYSEGYLVKEAMEHQPVKARSMILWTIFRPTLRMMKFENLSVKVSLLIPISVLITYVLSTHFLPTLILLPAVMILLSLLVTASGDFQPIIKSVLTYVFVGLNDIGIKLYSGGTHDDVGQSFIHLLSLLGILPVIILLAIKIFSDKRYVLRQRFLAMMLFIAFVCVHIFLWSDIR